MDKRSSVDWIGHREGRLRIVAFNGVKATGTSRATYFTFECDCGRRFEAQKSNVVGRRTDCGCSRAAAYKTAPPNSRVHPLFNAWAGMIDRCRRPENRSYRDYGGRGVSVCPRWRLGEAGKTGFECFVEDLGPRPTAQHTIERVDNAGNYEPGNCMWLGKGDQSKNRRGVKLVRIGDRAQTIPDWCAETGVGYWTAIRRIKRGWPPDRAVTESPRPIAAG